MPPSLEESIVSGDSLEEDRGTSSSKLWVASPPEYHSGLDLVKLVTKEGCYKGHLGSRNLKKGLADNI